MIAILLATPRMKKDLTPGRPPEPHNEGGLHNGIGTGIGVLASGLFRAGFIIELDQMNVTIKMKIKMKIKIR